MDLEFSTMLVTCFLVFLAGLIDSIAGGGGLISLPAYVFTGIPVHMAYGTNKFSSTLGTTFSTIRFIKSGQIHLKSAAVSVAGALIGSNIGARLALAIDEKYLKYFLIVMLPLAAIIVMFGRSFRQKDSCTELTNRKIAVFSFLIGLTAGAYDGFFGPGTGTFLIIMYTGIIGFSLSKASGNAKIVNLSSNISALVTFMSAGQVMYSIAVPAALCGIAGNWIGAGLAVKNGAKVIKPVLTFVLLLLFVKIIYDFIGG